MTETSNGQGAEAGPLDPAALRKLAEWGGEKLVRRMASLFLEHSPERMHQIRDGLDRDDPEGVERGAHSLKSSAANLGATRLRAILAGMEDRAHERELGRIREQLPELETVYSAAVEALTSLAAQGDQPPDTEGENR